ncbi:High-affinity branched-chain amino acid transport ATP-binding protein LivF [Usitatibacter rugosus]|uniref:High-affinity branched-chain amino acid transport ATP-binding protein LivF n=1 Tax=Usitatibacter rugosus TaxID=2732067 RepID=A0A6M4GPH1_9PROT|nr:ABC transporter ATP-binding protein [Usitatibacter rugosus]QJR09092.1 High-affinity branched-chain amino acid transport ATP-binding protein LivF [Usitatibacter rugosus]
MLEVRGLHAWYGKSHILQGVDLDVRSGEIVSLLGRNGVGRSTTVKSIMGQVVAKGAVRFRGEDLVGRRPHEIARRGLGYVPEDRAIFPDLTVRQNLALGRKSLRGAATFTEDNAYEMFPRLKERAETPGGVLSGGEQQMLTLCRTLMGDPKLVMVDEPTEGLAPKIVELVAQFLLAIRDRGIPILLVEQKLDIALDISERVYVLGHGKTVFEGTPAELRERGDIRKEWLEV